MRKIQPYFDAGPPDLWKAASKSAKKNEKNPLGLSEIDQALTKKGKHEFKSSIYGAKTVKNELLSIFDSKCAFCEANTYSGAHKDVEHFRPKKVYYWLAYEWSNLLLSCQICNRSYKKTNFPLTDPARQLLEHPVDANGIFDRLACHIHLLASEQPQLIHPAIDDPLVHLKFLPNGQIAPLTERGRVSILHYGLNRDKLIEARNNLILDLQSDIAREYLNDHLPDPARVTLETRKIIEKITDWINARRPYTGFLTAILQHFDAFIIDNTSNGIDLPNKDIMRKAAAAILTP